MAPKAQVRAPEETVLMFAHRTTPVFVQMMLIGVALARLTPGEVLRIHEFDHANTSGEEKMSSPYARECTSNTVRATIERLRLPCTTRTDGIDLVVERSAK